MNTVHKSLEKRTYITPAVECVKLDNEISLALESAPPAGPFETNASEYKNGDPFKANVG